MNLFLIQQAPLSDLRLSLERIILLSIGPPLTKSRFLQFKPRVQPDLDTLPCYLHANDIQKMLYIGVQLYSIGEPCLLYSGWPVVVRPDLMDLSGEPCPSISEALKGAATNSNVRENLFASLWTRLDPWHLGDDLSSNVTLLQYQLVQFKLDHLHLFKNWMNISIIMFCNQTIFFTSSFWNIIKRIN